MCENCDYWNKSGISLKKININYFIRNLFTDGYFWMIMKQQLFILHFLNTFTASYLSSQALLHHSFFTEGPHCFPSHIHIVSILLRLTFQWLRLFFLQGLRGKYTDVTVRSCDLQMITILQPRLISSTSVYLKFLGFQLSLQLNKIPLHFHYLIIS